MQNFFLYLRGAHKIPNYSANVHTKVKELGIDIESSPPLRHLLHQIGNAVFAVQGVKSLNMRREDKERITGIGVANIRKEIKACISALKKVKKKVSIEDIVSEIDERFGSSNTIITYDNQVEDGFEINGFDKFRILAVLKEIVLNGEKYAEGKVDVKVRINTDGITIFASNIVKKDGVDMTYSTCQGIPIIKELSDAFSIDKEDGKYKAIVVFLYTK